LVTFFILLGKYQVKTYYGKYPVNTLPGMYLGFCLGIYQFCFSIRYLPG